MVNANLWIIIFLLLVNQCAGQSESSLEPSDKELEQQLVLRALDRGPLFTLLGEIKPMSSDIWQIRFDSPDFDLATVAPLLGCRCQPLARLTWPTMKSKVWQGAFYHLSQQSKQE